MTRCKYCGKQIHHLPYAGWVETASADEGGNYDLCEKNPIEWSHEPLRLRPLERTR